MSTSPAASPSPLSPALRSPLPWLTVAALAALMAYADGFWLTSLQGAIGAIERSQHPASLWLRSSSLALPLFVAAVLAALGLARRRYGPQLAGGRAVLVAALLVALAGTAVGLTDVVVSSATDYGLQVEQIRLQHSLHTHSGAEALGLAGRPGEGGTGACPDSCRQAQRATLGAHARGIADAGLLVLGSNLLLTGWVVAARGGRLDARRTRRPVAAPA